MALSTRRRFAECVFVPMHEPATMHHFISMPSESLIITDLRLFLSTIERFSFLPFLFIWMTRNSKLRFTRAIGYTLSVDDKCGKYLRRSVFNYENIRNIVTRSKFLGIRCTFLIPFHWTRKLLSPILFFVQRCPFAPIFVSPASRNYLRCYCCRQHRNCPDQSHFNIVVVIVNHYRHYRDRDRHRCYIIVSNHRRYNCTPCYAVNTPRLQLLYRKAEMRQTRYVLWFFWDSEAEVTILSSYSTRMR